MKTIKIFILVVFLAGLNVLNTYSMTASANVDSVYNLIKGNWYPVVSTGGLTGETDSLRSNNIIQIERISGTDSVTWKVFQHDTLTLTKRYLITYSKSNIYRENKWTLKIKAAYSIPGLIIQADNQSFTTIPDVMDGSNVKYLRAINTANKTIGDSPLTFSPNPIKSSFTIRGIENMERIDILDINGKLLKSNQCKSSIKTIDISSLNKGVYFVKVISGNKSYVEKIVKN